MKPIHEMTFNEFKRFVSSQAKSGGNAVSFDDYSRDGTMEYFYPKQFYVNGDLYYWSYSKAHTKGKSLSTHYEFWGHGKAVGHKKYGAGQLNKTKLFKFLRDIHNYYVKEAQTISI